MRTFIAIALAWLLAIAGPSSAQMTLTGAGSVKAPQVASASLAVDGTPQIASGNSLTAPTLTITTSNSNDVVLVLMASSSTSTPPTVTSSHLTFTQRAVGNRFNSQLCYAFYAIAASPLTSEIITVTFPAASAGMANAIAISGANTASPFDPNVALPKEVGSGGAGGANAVVSTTHSNTFVYGIMYDSTLYPSAPTATTSGFTQLASVSGGLSQYKIESAPQTTLELTTSDTPSGSAANSDCAIGDAVTQ